MKIYLTDQDTGELFTKIEYAENFSVSHPDGIKEYIIQYNANNPDEFEKKIFIDGVVASFIHSGVHEKPSCFVTVEQPYMQMHFELSGHTLYTPKQKSDMECDIPYGSHCLLYFPVLNGILNKTIGNEIFRIEIEISLNYLNRVLNDDLSLLGKFAEDITDERPSMLGGGSFPITKQMRQILMEIYHCTFVSKLKKLFIEVKLQELLLLQIEQMTNTSVLSEANLNKADKNKIKYAKELIDANLDQPFSIQELSSLTGVNRTNLQKNFKGVFGTTIYGYIAEERMNQAKQLLLDEEYIKIAEVARKVGYKNANHFSTAFKKKFGYLPKTIKN